MSTVVKRNQFVFCASCRDKGCMRTIGGAGEQEYVSDEPCDCCEADFEANDGFDV